jgi:hypothetical protein
MGSVIRFPLERVSRSRPAASGRHQSASITILPVVRVERWGTHNRFKTTAAATGSSRLRSRRTLVRRIP